MTCLHCDDGYARQPGTGRCICEGPDPFDKLTECCGFHTCVCNDYALLCDDGSFDHAAIRKQAERWFLDPNNDTLTWVEAKRHAANAAEMQQERWQEQHKKMEAV